MPKSFKIELKTLYTSRKLLAVASFLVGLTFGYFLGLFELRSLISLPEISIQFSWIQIFEKIKPSIKFDFNFWDNLIQVAIFIVGVIISLIVSSISKKQTLEQNYQHEKDISKKIEEIRKDEYYKSVILADYSKLKDRNQDYPRQGCELYGVIENYGVEFILLGENEGIKTGLVPFEWIKFIKEEGDAEHKKPIIVCDFKGEVSFTKKLMRMMRGEMKYYENYKSPFEEFGYIYKNLQYVEGMPEFKRYSRFPAFEENL